MTKITVTSITIANGKLRERKMTPFQTTKTELEKLRQQIKDEERSKEQCEHKRNNIEVLFTTDDDNKPINFD